MKIYILAILCAILSIGILTFNDQKASAYQIGEGKIGIDINPSVPYDAGQEGVDKIFDTIFNTAIVVSSVVFVVILLIGGVLYLTSAGAEEQAKKARSMILQAVIGLIITLAAWAVGTWIIGILYK